MIDIKECAGCENDYYNSNVNPIYPERCWHAENGQMGQFMLIHINQAPPYKPRFRELPSCYRVKQFVKISPEALDADGYWK